MTVREMIEKLGAFHPDLRVLTDSGYEVENIILIDEERKYPLSDKPYRAHHVEIGPTSA